MTILDAESFEHAGKTYRRETHIDDAFNAPWEEEDGHGPVTDWTHRPKRPGELVLAQDHGAHRLYDFEEACEIARRDCWGWLPGKLKTDAIPGGFVASCTGVGFAVAPDINRAISALYKKHRESMSARAYAAEAARKDFERLRGWCAGEWQYLGVRVLPVCVCCGTPDDSRAASVWGVESDAGDYLDDIARELVDEIPEPEKET